MKGYKAFLKRLAHFQTTHPYVTLLIILAITIIFYGGASQVRTVASLEQMMPSEISEISAFNDLRDAGLGQDMVAIVIKVNSESTDPNGIMDITDYEMAQYTQKLKSLIGNEPDILETYTFSDVIVAAYGSMPDEETYYALLENPELSPMIDQFVNHDKTTTMILAKTDVSADDDRMNSLATKIKSHVKSVGHPSGVEVQMTGTPVIQQKLGELIGKDRTTTQNISTILVFIITMILFGTISSALVPIIIVTISVAWLYGTMGYTNLPISTLAGGVAAMVIGIGIDYSIHIMNKFKNERQKGKRIREAIEEAITTTGVALTGAAFATALAFLAFLVGVMPEMGRFGLLMGIGVTYSFILSIFGLPALLIVEEKIIHKIAKRVRFGVEGEYRLYNDDESHPDEAEVVNLSDEELLRHIKKKKIVRMPNKNKGGKNVR